ncbi:hypothetical protein OKA05_10220 [Luteolibacter arcticus]|uniref:Uncharacterized protein n=1 Tax=Luteolibacter arcticus TaxID=1581411 RepID=A0ABT3GH52_9BACT|nr:hypothetical protein [Luteolibacter arcticus]MCW1922927.1 hypothetical protein [Luteolibacter arcticus]
MIPKLNFVSALAAVLFFFLPWTSIECRGQQMATQTGVQLLTGGATAVERIEASQIDIKSRKDSWLGRSYLAMVALLCAVSAVVTGFAALATGHKHISGGPGMLCACALLCLIAQATLEFPAKRELTKEMGGKNRPATSSGRDGLESALSQEVASRIQVRLLPGFYAELAALGIPTLILLNGLLDRLRAAGEKRA